VRVGCRAEVVARSCRKNLEREAKDGGALEADPHRPEFQDLVRARQASEIRHSHQLTV
jgi:hypothetical protein